MTRLALLLPVLLAAPAWAVGLGPLSKEGVIDGPREAFFLTLINPYREPTDFIAYPIGVDDEARPGRVIVQPTEARLGAGDTRRLLVVAEGLAVGETYRFRVCAERRAPPQGIEINARVCSKITARRVA